MGGSVRPSADSNAKAGAAFDARVAAGRAREAARLRGHRFVLALAVSEFDQKGMVERLELLQPVASLEDGAVRAEGEARARAEFLREALDWVELPAGAARALAPFDDAPFLAVRKIGDGRGLNSLYVRVAVLPLDPDDPLGPDFLRAAGLEAELALWFVAVAERAG